jgi:2-polyprenyl-3-methyl-5-hydroxy-6-metoxy-1,4-benzoquinol methylase
MSGATPALSDYPELAQIVNLISSENPLQRKRINAFLVRQDPGYWQFAEELSRTLNRAFLRTEQDRIAAARSYNRTCMDLLREQIRFRRVGTYLLQDAQVAQETVYSQDAVMRYYVVGLLLSYLFWPNHYEIFRFFQEHVGRISINRCLEVGAGHGLFTAEVLHRVPGARLTLVDISETSIELVREMLVTFGIESSRVEFIRGDYLESVLPTGNFEFIIMGEVLEHVNDAPRFLSLSRELLRPGGTLFLSTCVNCPAVDHVYHFHKVGEIQDLIAAAGLSVVRELTLPAEAVPKERWEEELVTINYCGILAREGTDA